MVTVIYPTDAFNASVSAIFIVQRELNLIVNSFFGRKWLAVLILAGDR